MTIGAELRHKRHGLWGCVLLVMLLLLGACGGGQSSPTAAPTEAPSMMEEMEGDEHGTMSDMGHGDMDMTHGATSNSAAYMLITNSADAPDALIAAATDAAAIVELHTVDQGADGVMQMRPVEQIEIPGQGETILQPGGFHVMLLDIQRTLNEGDMVELTLTFANAGEVRITAPVRMMASMDDVDVTPVTSADGNITVDAFWVRSAAMME